MRIAILGSGLMGGKLGTLFARAGTPGEAAREADALVLAVHWSRVLPLNADNTELVVRLTSGHDLAPQENAGGRSFPPGRRLGVRFGPISGIDDRLDRREIEREGAVDRGVRPSRA